MKTITLLWNLALVGITLVVAKPPPVLVTTTSLDNLVLGDSATFWSSVPENMIFYTYVVATQPNGTSEIVCRSSNSMFTNITLQSDGSVSVSETTNPTDELCVHYAGRPLFGCTWIPPVSGNWKVTVGTAFFYAANPAQYEFRGQETVCLKPPLTHEQATVATYEFSVSPQSASVTTINTSTIIARDDDGDPV
ncbi:hypothetical protein FRC17_010440 [Serendipita sp. 399]|nr:hypothetical protein FRC17_010440 [Serendipita sp. 399]